MASFFLKIIQTFFRDYVNIIAKDAQFNHTTNDKTIDVKKENYYFYLFESPSFLV